MDGERINEWLIFSFFVPLADFVRGLYRNLYGVVARGIVVGV